MKIDRIYWRVVVVVVAASALAQRVTAAEISGVKMPDQVTLQDKTLKLNGLGLRQATLLKVNVYAGGLYLENLSRDGEAIANSDQLKSMEMVMMRDVGAKDIVHALEEGFARNCEGDCGKFKPQLAELQRMVRDVRRGESISYHFLSDKVEVLIGGQKVAAVEGKPFARQLIRCWIGKNPPNPGLKEGLLGLKKS